MSVVSTSSRALPTWLLLLMAVATGVAVASNYYAQPLLHTIAERLDLSYSRAGIVVTVAQLGYALGLLALVPLGDMLERRRLVVTMMSLSTLGLLVSATANGLPMLLLGTAVTALFSVVAQVLVPFAATLAEPDRRGRAVGTVMSGLMLGILLARSFAGALSEFGDWRLVYWVASGLMALTTLALWRALPALHTPAGLSYAALIRSVGTLMAVHARLRLRALLGLLTFASFAAFWTPIAFLLAAPPYRLSDGVIGLFGLVGAAGALMAPITGRQVDRGRARLTTTLGLALLVLGWVPLLFAGQSLLALLLGILILDLAVQLVHITNLNMVYRIDPGARNRLNAAYMVCYFLGGALGSLFSAMLYVHWGWLGVCALGIGFSALGLAVWLACRARVEADTPKGQHG
ncbi:MFS transporter [Halotalea alkalilenta]|uniref:MFS transporter n=1 Tax=Halotalea alkalilenta TaxID=376489 RepID=UPI000AECA6A9|nr:MFS transporter [Halotalea alkalilenta]